jgi:hypothetical protein
MGLSREEGGTRKAGSRLDISRSPKSNKTLGNVNTQGGSCWPSPPSCDTYLALSLSQAPTATQLQVDLPAMLWAWAQEASGRGKQMGARAHWLFARSPQNASWRQISLWLCARGGEQLRRTASNGKQPRCTLQSWSPRKPCVRPEPQRCGPRRASCADPSRLGIAAVQPLAARSAPFPGAPAAS